MFKKLKKIDNKSAIIFTITLSVLLLFYQRNIINNIELSVNTKVLIVLASQLLLYSVSFVFFVKKDIEIEKKFAIISISLGLIFMTIVPIYQVADEVVHSYRAFGVATGESIFENSQNSLTLPKSIKEFYDFTEVGRIAFKNKEKVDKEKYLEAIKMPLNKKDTIEYDASATTSYTVIAYIPQAIGLFLGNILNLPIYFVLLLGRLSNFLIWVLICAMAIKVVPFKKELFMFVMLIPMSLNQGMSMSPDAILNSSSFLLIAYILNLKYKNDEIKMKDYIILLFLVIAIVSVKMPYILISILVFIIPSKKIFSKIKLGKINFIKNILLLLTMLLLGVSVFAGWNGMLSKAVEDNQQIGIEEESIVKEEEGLGATIKYVVNNPKQFLKTCIITLQTQKEHYKNSFFGYFGWLDQKIPYKLINLIIMVGVVIIINGERDFKLKIWDRFVLISIALGLMLVLFMVSLQWYGMEHGFFPGIQGRYFYPFMLCLILPFTNSRFSFKIQNYSTYVALFSMFALIISTNVLYMRYWT